MRRGIIHHAARLLKRNRARTVRSVAGPGKMPDGGRNSFMYSILLVGLGSALGGIARYGISLLLARLFGETFPWGTLCVNVTGSFVIGFFFTMTGVGGRWLVSPEWRIFVTVGICGGYTTFSSFSLQTLALLRDGEWPVAGLNAFGSLTLCMAAVWLGFLCASALNAKS